MNHLRLTAVRDEAEYKQEAAKRAELHRDARKRQQERDRRDGLADSKKRAREVLQASLGDHRAKFVETVAQAMGWDTRFPAEKYQNLSDAALRRAQQRHANGLMKRAREAVDMQQQRLVADAEARGAAGLGEVKLTSSKPDEITAEDLAPVAPPNGRGLGFDPEYGKRAAAAGLTAEEKRQEAEATKPQDPERQAAAAERKVTAQKIAGELATVRDPLPQVDPKRVVDDRAALAMVKARKALQQAERAARDANKQIDVARTTVEPRAFVIETRQASDDEALKDLENDLKTVRTRAFVSEVGKMIGERESVGGHIAAGAFNSINALALAAGGSALLDRSTVDVLGTDGAARVLARRLQADLSPQEMDELRGAMERYHIDHYMRVQATDGALRDARTWHEMAQEIELGAASTGHDLMAAQELNARRREYVGKAQQVLGVALGEMEANAALVAALGRKKPEASLTVSMGKLAPEQAIAQARAIGLQRGEYRIERVGASTMLTVEAAGMDRLAKPVSRSDLARTRGALDIIEGRRDEDGWLPEGVAKRLDLGRDDMKPGVAPSLAQPFPDKPADVRQAVRDYIGARAADGDTPADILAGLLNEETIQRAGDRDAYFRAVEEVAPSKDAEGKQIRAEAHADRFAELADDYTSRGLGGKLPPLHRQKFAEDDAAADALHRALAAHPEGVAAFKPVGDLTPQEQGMLRGVFAAEFAKSAGPEAQAKQQRLAELGTNEPEREVEDMFGRGENPLWREWKAERDGLAEELNRDTMTWGKYLAVMGSPAAGYAAMQDVVRSKVVGRFAEELNRLRPAEAVKVGKTTIRGDIDHLGALNPEERERRETERKKLAGAMQARVGGKFASDDVKGKILREREAQAAIAQSQMGLFGFEEPAPKAEEGEAGPLLPELRQGERLTIGHQAEQQLQRMMGRIGANFRPGTAPVNLWRPDMSGKFVGRQRAVKLIEHSKRVALGLGVGSGKTSIALSAFTHLKAKGKAKRGLFIVPSIAQGQFHGEALNVLEPGRYRWHAEPGASREERIAAYKDPSIDFNVVTHAAFRDDMLHLAAAREGSTPDIVAEKLDGMTPEGRAAYMRDLLAAEGIDHDYLAVDEGHQLLNREGKENSRMANVIDGISDSRSYYVNLTADSVKNDASEAFDVLAKMDRARYSDRDAFMRRYGANTPAAREELRRELARHLYAGHIKPEVQVRKQDVKVALGERDRAQLAAIDKAAAAARIARMKGEVDLPALRTLAPGAFEDVPEAQHEDVARELNQSIGILRATAARHAIDGSAKVDKLSELARERAGKPGVVFAHSLARVKEIAERLTREGHRVVTLTGTDTSKEKDAKKQAFQSGKADIIICSDAGAVGANLQRGQWLAQFDTPQTAMVHNQRQGRINRIGQKNDIELLDLIADHPEEEKARKRLADKYELRAIMSDPLEGLDDRGIAGFLNRARAGKQEEAAPLFEATPDEEAPPAPEPEEQHSLF
ncbi:helicase-related protein [Rhodovastum atsumiense]|uniref:Helicase C-terminal domain-containing protein n=1 Tax=Rhodovastum atsumiense TaxID=504468 RepID=A0A5M6IUK1_9PROT|nr:helicase-related protein [Rhodovastum atsumiense]KAA5611629.1 hypothetical protein F1189_13800 [Rhodovastum atsumiense]